ncbi:hypothetical protein GCM10007242_34600 [Pigmentiphaga litoralis]|nr:hypothetical protein GCM10007242_34600 [Pigmentiphaga litoralis]
MEQRGLPQSVQYTDALDQQLGVWGDIFLDTVDIHSRISNINLYGPVLFTFDLDFLDDLDEETRVLITRSNPTRWKTTTSHEDRYFADADRLDEGFSAGDFNQMLVIRTPTKVIKFSDKLDRIVLDYPSLNKDAEEIFDKAQHALVRSLGKSLVGTDVIRRHCRINCKCGATYEASSARTQYFEV